LSTDQYLEKFRNCLGFSATPLSVHAAGQLIEQIDRLDRLADVRLLAGLAAGKPI
jgi:hypothetical protein